MSDPSKSFKRGKYAHSSNFKTYVGHQMPNSNLNDVNTSVDMYANSKIAQIQFQIMKNGDTARNSHVEVVQRTFYEQDRQIPVSFGVLDRRMGISTKDGVCTTCHKDLASCIGHFGHINLELPVFHIGFIKEVQKILQAICKKCSRVLLPNNECRDYYISKIVKAERRSRMGIRDEILDIAKRCKSCVHCGARNGQIKKLPGMFKLIHDLREKETKRERDNKAEREKRQKEQLKAFRKARLAGLNPSSQDFQFSGQEEEVALDDYSRTAPPETWREEFYGSFQTAIKYNSVLGDYLDRAVLEMSPLLALKLFTAVPDEDCYLLNLDPAVSRPEDMIITQLVVPPVCLRPSVAMGTSGSNEDDLTVKLGDIIYVNNFIKNLFQTGGQTSNIIENWDFIQQQVAMLVNSDLPGFNKAAISAKPIRSLTQRLKGKTGRFRGNLSGKRVDFSSRTVISPDPNLRIDQVGVPDRVAKILTYPERVFTHNINDLRKAVINGPDVHPGANMVEFSNGKKIYLKFGDRYKVAQLIKEGDIVERHLRDDDVVLFNRQPSLHRMSIMAHRAKVLQWRTFRFNECVCTPYNADFDGDEMNLHLPQTHEARAEAQQLMSVMNNLVTPRNGEPLIAATQDFITSSFLITSKDLFLTRGSFCHLVAGMGDANEQVEVPHAAIVKPMTLWTGKQVFSLLLRPTQDFAEGDEIVPDPWPVITVELKSKNNTRVHPLDPVDGYVVIRNSELMCGSIDKDALGGSKKGMYFQIIRSGPNGAENAARFLNRLAKFSSRFIGSRGFSIGIDDVTPSSRLSSLKNDLVIKGYENCQKDISLYESGKLTLRPGCDEIQTLESLLLGELSAIREDAGSECFRELDLLYNSPLIMAISGSKGSKINISQMTACVGQQAISGSRIPEGFHLRTLPHFPKFSRDPDAKGFVANSFFTGLTATEFFFHTMGGREGLVDTAVKTAETGYMQRRLMKALEDLCVQYDGSVRTSERNVVQFKYGDDGLDPVLMANGALPVNFPIYFEQCRANYTSIIANNGANVIAMLSSIVPHHQVPLVMDNSGNLAIQNGTIYEIEDEASTEFVDWVAYAVTNKAANFVSDALKTEESLELFAGSRRQDLCKYDALIYPAEFIAIVNAFCNHYIISTTCTKRFIEALQEFIASEYKIIYDLLDSVNTDNASLLSDEENAVALRLMTQCRPIYKTHLNMFLNGLFSKYVASIIEPGTAVGAIGGQSIGEPGTQMTLKTFHFAGVASMNITLGVPRIKEIINASKKINTPIITAPLECDNDVKTARIVKGRIETTKLGQIAKSIEAVFSPNGCYLRVIIDTQTIDDLQLNIDVRKVAFSLENAKKLKLKKLVHVYSNEVIHIDAPELQLNVARNAATSSASSSVLQSLHALKHEIADVVVEGISSVSRAVINDDGSGKYHLLVEGYDLASVMSTLGVRGRETTSNHIMEVWKVLGIEAARLCIVKEMSSTFEAHGLNVDPRHMTLLADIMTYRGEVLGITRFGIAKMKESVLMLASFEKTADHLFEAALRGTTDNISGVSECIIMGSPMPVGTGLFSLLQQAQKAVAPSIEDFEKAAKKLHKKGKSRDGCSVLKQIESDKKLVGPIVEKRKTTLATVDEFASRSPLLMKFSRFLS